MRARALGYNMMLADMKLSPRPFQDATNNTWRIEPASEEKSPSKVLRFAKRARQYLDGVIEDHRGTQWEASPGKSCSRRWGGTGTSYT